MRTKDRRIQAATGPAVAGTYVGYRANTVFAITRGPYRRSFYFYKRNGLTTTWQTGAQPALTVTEMNLLKAEALIRLNRAAEAVPLINASRVAQGQLPAATMYRPPDDGGCVPSKLSSARGSLRYGLRHAKR